MSTATAIATMNDLTEEVRETFAKVTRYPLEILDPAASLEEDLGIDSVKVGEVFGVLRERYNLSDKLNIPRENLRNIESIAAGLREFLQDGAGRPAVAATQASHPPTAAAAVVAASPTPVAEDLARSVCDIFADVTRYPIDILDPAASLEEDLGIDSVKVGEVFAVLRERYNLPEDMQI